MAQAKMRTVRFLAKRNQDASYSISLTARELVDFAWVDFYDDKTGSGYQRRETLRERRGREIEDYFRRCANHSVTPRLFEMTGNLRSERGGPIVKVAFDALDENGEVGFVVVTAPEGRWLSMIDGGTRLHGIDRALESNTIGAESSFDIRLFVNLTFAEEIALFLLINEKQKRVRTDLGVRIVQRRLDDGTLTEQEMLILNTVVPDTEQWRYEAVRIVGRLNGDPDSSWNGYVQMPGETAVKPVRLQAMWTSLRHLVDDADLKARIKQMMSDGALTFSDTGEFFLAVLKNFWGAVADVSPATHAEPRTNVLWGSIGANACHRALSEVLRSMLSAEAPDLRRERFREMLIESSVADYDYWYNRKGVLRDEYPIRKGEATEMTGNAGYIRLSSILEEQWRAALHAAGSKKTVSI